MVDLPADDDAADEEYAADALEVIGDGYDVVVVAESMAGSPARSCASVSCQAARAAQRDDPAAGRGAGSMVGGQGHAEARAAQAARDGRSLDDDPDLLDAVFHDVPQDVTAEAMARGAPEQLGTPFGRPWPLERWPDVPTRVPEGRDDRFFPVSSSARSPRIGSASRRRDGGRGPRRAQPAGRARRAPRGRPLAVGVG